MQINTTPGLDLNFQLFPRGRLALVKTWVAMACLAIVSPLALQAQDGWVNLFNGTNLDGWEEHSGKAKYTVEDGVLTGESVAGTGNSFLCTKQMYGNFELELEFKCDPLLNSGVQIRSEVYPGSTTAVINGKTYKFPANRVHGYQCEIDMDAARGRMWTGGIYDEARRGWLFPTGGEKGEPGKAFPPKAVKSARAVNGTNCASFRMARPSRPG